MGNPSKAAAKQAEGEGEKNKLETPTTKAQPTVSPTGKGKKTRGSREKGRVKKQPRENR